MTVIDFIIWLLIFGVGLYFNAKYTPNEFVKDILKWLLYAFIVIDVLQLARIVHFFPAIVRG